MNEDYYWELVKDVSKKNKAHFSYEEKCSAAGLGLAYAIDSYRPAMGRQLPYFIECMNLMIEASRKKSNEYRRIESDFSLDKSLFNENGVESTAHDFLLKEMLDVEKSVMLREFCRELTEDEWDAMSGYRIRDIEQWKAILNRIKKKYIYFCK